MTTWAYQVRFIKDNSYETGTVRVNRAFGRDIAIEKIKKRYEPEEIEIVNLGVRE